jgi:hypothetical protein
MATLTDYVQITITRDTVGITAPGYGTPLVLGYSATWADRIRFYEDLPSMVTDGFATDSPEYLAVQAMLSQNPRPVQVAVGKGLLKPTQVYVVGVNSVANTTNYVVTVAGHGVTTTTLTYTSDSSATNDEIVAGLVTALNGVVGKNYTAVATGSAGSQVVTITASSAGEWFSIAIDDPAFLSNKQTQADPGIATDLAAILNANPGFYGVYTTFNSQAIVAATAAWVEANTRIYVPDVPETLAVTTTGGSGGSADTLDALHTSNYARTLGAYHPSPVNMLGAAWLGKMLPLDPGSATWKFKTLGGVAFTKYTTTQRNNLLSRQANGYENVAGLSVTFEGTSADGEYLDAIVGDDWVTTDMQVRILTVMAAANKTEFEDTGIARVEAAVRATLKEAVRRKIYAASPRPQVTVPLAANVSTADKSTRTLPDIKWTATRSGAIHKTKVQGTVSL